MGSPGLRASENARFQNAAAEFRGKEHHNSGGKGRIPTETAKKAPNGAAFYLILTLLYWISTYTAVPIVPTYARSLLAGPVMIGLIGGAYGLAQSLLRMPIGLLSDRLDRRKGFILGGGVCALAAAAVALLFPTPTALLAGRALCGFHAATWVPYTVLYARGFPPRDTGRAMARLLSFSSFGQLAGMLLGGAVSEAWGYPAAFVFAAGGSCLLLLLTALRLRDIPAAAPAEESFVPPEKAAADQRAGGFLTGRLLLLTAVGVVFFYVKYGTAYTFTPILAEGLGANKFELGLLNTLYCLVGIAGAGLSHRLAQRFGPRRMLCLGLLASAVFSGFAVPYLTNLPRLFAAMAVAGFLTLTLDALVIGLVILGVPERRRSTVMGFYQAVYGLGIFFGPVVSGAVADAAGLPAAYWAAGTLALLCVALVRLGLRADCG